MKYGLVTLFCSFLFLNSCNSDAEQTKHKHLTNPEELVRQWQSHIDNNQFDEAKKISTKNGQAEVEGIMKEIIDEDFPDNFISQTVFEAIKCHQSGQEAVCVCQVKEEEGRDSFFLLKTKDHWLFDKLVFEDFLSEDDLVKELEEDLNKLLESDK